LAKEKRAERALDEKNDVYAFSFILFSFKFIIQSPSKPFFIFFSTNEESIPVKDKEKNRMKSVLERHYTEFSP